MTIKNKDVILISYVAYDQSGNIFDTTSRELAKHIKIYNEKEKYEPVCMIVGECQIVKGLDKDVVDKELEYEGEVIIPPKWAFGEYDKELLKTFKINEFTEKPVAGKVINAEEGRGTVTAVLGSRARVDFNHHLAGQTLKYNYKILHIAQNDLEKLSMICKSVVNFNMCVEIKQFEDKKIAIIDTPLNIIKDLGVWHGLKQIIMRHVLNNIDVDYVWFVEKFVRQKE